VDTGQAADPIEERAELPYFALVRDPKNDNLSDLNRPPDPTRKRVHLEEISRNPQKPSRNLRNPIRDLRP
jgi:hypothetical protein